MRMLRLFEFAMNMAFKGDILLQDDRKPTQLSSAKSEWLSLDYVRTLLLLAYQIVFGPMLVIVFQSIIARIPDLIKSCMVHTSRTFSSADSLCFTNQRPPSKYMFRLRLTTLYVQVSSSTTTSTIRENSLVSTYAVT